MSRGPVRVCCDLALLSRLYIFLLYTECAHTHWQDIAKYLSTMSDETKLGAKPAVWSLHRLPAFKVVYRRAISSIVGRPIRFRHISGPIPDQHTVYAGDAG